MLNPVRRLFASHIQRYDTAYFNSFYHAELMVASNSPKILRDGQVLLIIFVENVIIIMEGYRRLKESIDNDFYQRYSWRREDFFL